MIDTYNLDNGLPLFKALGSQTRIKIYRLISEHEGLNIKQLARLLSMPMSTLSPHLQLLSETGLIRIMDSPTPQGKQKCCYLSQTVDQLMINITETDQFASVYRAEIPVGYYTDFSVTPTCGLASDSSFLGKLDEPRYFAHPGRYQAQILWFTTGYLEYTLPNFIPIGNTIEQLSVSFEIASEAPRNNNNWPSGISFILNGILLGTWTSPADFGDRPGSLNPDWWYPFLNQYGLLKELSITTEGTFLGREKLSDITIDSLALTDQSILKLRFSVDASARHPGGCTLFGRDFGNHPQAISVAIRYHRSLNMQ